jgi:hypothetical protein
MARLELAVVGRARKMKMDPGQRKKAIPLGTAAVKYPVPNPQSTKSVTLAATYQSSMDTNI